MGLQPKAAHWSSLGSFSKLPLPAPQPALFNQIIWSSSWERWFVNALQVILKFSQR